MYLERQYNYQGYTIEQWKSISGKRYFYPAINGNIESTNIRDIIRWIKGIIWMRKISSI